MVKKHIHFIGIKGVGMTSLAIYAKEKGYKVTGSDVQEEFVTDKILKKFKIPIKIGFGVNSHWKKPDMVIVTGAHGGKTNPEAVYYIVNGIEVLTHGQALGYFMQDSFGISVAGVGGKTTTSAMIATILNQKPMDSSYVIGVGNIASLKQPGHFGKSKFFISEADEYASCPLTDLTPRFLYQHPHIGVITCIEFDHPDLYRSFEQTKEMFGQFINGMQKSGVVIINGDNKNNREVIQKINREVKTYGFSKENDYQIDKVRFKEGSTEFILRNKSIILGNFIIKVPGKLNIQNATAAIIAALTAGLTINQIQKGLVLFTGTKRRFELIKEKNDIKLIDDYAHHPSEIQMTLLAAKEWYPGYKIICIFQPHTFSRTKALLSDFSQSFGLSSEVYILPIFPSAREKEDNSINSFILVNETARYHQRVFYAKDHIDLLQKLKNNIKPKTILITMGAGDIYKIHTDLIKLMSYGR